MPLLIQIRIGFSRCLQKLNFKKILIIVSVFIEIIEITINMLQITSYSIYIPIVIYITYWVGLDLHKNGRVYISQSFGEDSDWVDPINNTLLLGYFFLNTGVAFIKIRGWPEVSSVDVLVHSICVNTGELLLLLGLIHVFNLTSLTIIYQKRIKINL